MHILSRERLCLYVLLSAVLYIELFAWFVDMQSCVYWLNICLCNVFVLFSWMQFYKGGNLQPPTLTPDDRTHMA